MTFSRQDVFNVVPSAIAFVEGRENPHSLTVDKTRLLPDAKGRYTLLANTWMAEITPNVYGALPRAVVTQEFLTSSATGKVNDCWRYLKVGDVLRVVEPYIFMTVSTGWAANDTITLTLDGNAIVLTITGTGGVLPANIAAEAASLINAHPLLSKFVRAVASGALIFLYGKSDIPIPAAVSASTAGAGDVVISGPGVSPSRLVANTVVGTILRIDTDGTITLAGNASVAVPVGGHIGIPVLKIFGIMDIDIDLTYLDRYSLSPTSGAHGVYENLLTYCDDLLKAEFARLNISTKF